MSVASARKYGQIVGRYIVNCISAANNPRRSLAEIV